MTAATIAAICSAFAALASALAAWKSFSLANTTAARAEEAERRILEHDIDETARAIQVESRRAASVYEQIKPLQDGASTLANSYGGSGYKEIVGAITETRTRIAEIQERAGSIANVPPGGKLSAGDLAARLPSLRAHLIEIRGILDDGLSERDRLVQKIARLIAERNDRNNREMLARLLQR